MARPNDNDASIPFPILIGDIGGTNARFALLVDAYAEPKFFPNVQTAEFATINDTGQRARQDVRAATVHDPGDCRPDPG